MKTLGFISPIVGRNVPTREYENTFGPPNTPQNSNENHPNKGKKPTVEKLETTSRGRHALTAMIDLTKLQDGRPVPLSEIAARRQISLSYLEQMFSGLRRHGLVKSHRGPGGGYRLGLPPQDITVAAIMRAAEDSPSAQRSRQNARRTSQSDCPSGRLWESLNGLVYTMLDHVSLDDVVAERVEVYQKIFKTEGR